MNSVSELFHSLRDRLPRVLGFGMLVLILTGELIFAALQIVPAVRAHNELSSQLAEARQALVPLVGEAELEATLQRQLTMMRETLNAQASAFLAESEVPVVLNHLYRYAEESGVQITQVEAARGAGPKTTDGALHDIQSFQIEVSGPTLQLVDFVTRLQEASLPTVILEDLEIRQGRAVEGASTLTMRIHLYTSTYVTDEASQ